MLSSKIKCETNIHRRKRKGKKSVFPPTGTRPLCQGWVRPQAVNHRMAPRQRARKRSRLPRGRDPRVCGEVPAIFAGSGPRPAPAARSLGALILGVAGSFPGVFFHANRGGERGRVIWVRLGAGVGTRFGEPDFLCAPSSVPRCRFVPVPRLLSAHAGYVLVRFDLGGEVVVGTENPAFTHLRNY